MSTPARGREPAAADGARDLAADLKSTALALGFDLVGISRAEPNEGTRALRDWLARGFGGDMHYLERRLEEREDPRKVLPGARSIITVALDYDVEPLQAVDSEPASPRAPDAVIARYARGDDYHRVALDRLRALGAALEALADAPVAWRAYVDTGPVQERVHAARAGLGWLGKNTCLIHPELGSYLFLGVLLCDVELPPDVPETDHCGSCRACLDACPTDAFAEPGVLDATRCIAYTTIESPAAIPEALREGQGDRVFGCDICQEVCPWNTRRGRRRPADPLGLRARLRSRPEWNAPPLAWLLSLHETDFQTHTRGSPIRRTGWRGLLRNALVSAGASRDASLLPAVERLCTHEDEIVREHALWARERLQAASRD
jgi:epoxyqueuosine reductase